MHALGFVSCTFRTSDTRATSDSTNRAGQTYKKESPIQNKNDTRVTSYHHPKYLDPDCGPRPSMTCPRRPRSSDFLRNLKKVGVFINEQPVAMTLLIDTEVKTNDSFPFYYYYYYNTVGDATRVLTSKR